jgi:hypothetical protein
MISLTVTGQAEPEQDRAEIARLLKEHGVGAVCLLRSGMVAHVKRRTGIRYDLGEIFGFEHEQDGMYEVEGNGPADIIRVFPPGTRFRVTMEVVE